MIVRTPKELGQLIKGAIQFAAPEHVAALVGHAKRSSEADWLTTAEIAAELRTVREQGIPGTTRSTVGQFSLAGAQPKIALLEEDGRWGRPTGRTPTNRILKPPSREYRGFAENEHFCLGLSGELGLGAVRSRVLRFDDEIAIVVDRFDRVRRGGSYRRIHQEDVCQALAVMPTRKYENEGGPGIHDVISVLRDSSRQPEDDIDRFIGLLVVNWVIAATDGHAKNYALLHGPGGGTRLAPFYDIASYLPYADPGLHRVKLAMKIGTNYLVRRISRSGWEALARANGIPMPHVLQRAEEILSALPSAIEAVHNAAVDEGLDERFIDELSGLIEQRVQSCSAAMGGHA
jgi:serine/threonine-protein kinase HipA